MKIWEHLEQRSEAWERARAGRPTASQFSRIITSEGKDSRQWWDYATELVAECIRPDEIEWAGNRHTDRGEELEPEARELFLRYAPGVDLKEVGFITRHDEIVGCSPDALVYRDGDCLGGLEIKCPLGRIHSKYLLEDRLPPEYKAQVHGGMAVTGLNWWYFLSYCPGFRPFVRLIERDQYTEQVEDALDRFLVFYAQHRKEVLPKLTNAQEQEAHRE